MSLAVLQIEALKGREKPYRRPLGGSLYVIVYPSGSKSYEFRYKRDGVVRSIIIGKIERIGLATARKERDRLKTKLASGLDPLAQRRIAGEQERVRLQEAQQAAVARRAAVAGGDHPNPRKGHTCLPCDLDPA